MASTYSLDDILAMKTRSQNQYFIDFMDRVVIDLSMRMLNGEYVALQQQFNGIAAEVIRAGCPNLFTILVETYHYETNRMECLSIAVYNGQEAIARYILQNRKSRTRATCEHLVYVALGVRNKRVSIDQGVELIRLLKSFGAIYTNRYDHMVSTNDLPSRVSRALLA